MFFFITENGAVLWHCSTGKDLTGIAAAILLCALGVSGNEIREDYRRTDSCLEKEKIYTMRFLESCPDTGKRETKNAEVIFCHRAAVARQGVCRSGKKLRFRGTVFKKRLIFNAESPGRTQNKVSDMKNS